MNAEKCKEWVLDHQKQLIYGAAGALGTWYLQSVSLKDQYVLITGGSEGIGAALAEDLVRKNAKIILLARNKEKLENVKQDLSKLSSAVHCYAVDCSDFDQVNSVAKKILAEHGAPYSIINNAGAGVWKFLHESTKEELDQCLNAPFLASLYVTRAFLPSMIKRNSGNITFVQSPAGLSSWGSATAYISARHALHGLYESISADLYNTNIKVNEMVLGLTSSNYFVNNKESYQSIPIFGRLLGTITPGQAAKAIVKQIESNKSGMDLYPLSLKVIVGFKDLPLVRWAIIQSGTTVKV